MGTKAPLILIALAMLSTRAHAGISDDIVFCSKIASSRERVACYDAVARSARRAAPARQPVSPASAAPLNERRVAMTANSTIDAPLPFHGFYAAAGGSYGISQPRPVTFTDQIGTFADSIQHEGLSFKGLVGYGVQTGAFALGFELDGRWGSEHGSASGFQTATNFNVTGAAYRTATSDFDGSLHALVRAGLAVGESLVFARAGAGFTHLARTAQTVGSGAICTRSVGLICQTSTPVTSDFGSRETWRPSILLGTGFERNWGSIFSRFGFDAEAIPTTSVNDESDLLWVTRVSAMIGYRF